MSDCVWKGWRGLGRLGGEGSGFLILEPVFAGCDVDDVALDFLDHLKGPGFQPGHGGGWLLPNGDAAFVDSGGEELSGALVNGCALLDSLLL